MYFLQSLRGEFFGFHLFTLFLKICQDDAILSEAVGGEILATKFGTVSVPDNFVLVFLEALPIQYFSCSYYFLERPKYLS